MNKVQVVRNIAVRASLLAVLVLFVAGSWAQSHQSESQPIPGGIALTLDPAHSKVHWTLGATMHTVHGTFGLKSGNLQFDPASGKASGEVIVFATSGESGNDSRDEKMHKEVLEVQRYPDVIFRPDRIEGKVLPQGSSKVQLHGIFVLHGAEHEMTVPVEADLTGDHWKGSAKFSVPYVQWGLKNPSTFLLKVSQAVDIELEMTGSLLNRTSP